MDELDALIKELREERSALEIHVKQSEAAENSSATSITRPVENQQRLQTKANRFEISIDQKLTCNLPAKNTN